MASFAHPQVITPCRGELHLLQSSENLPHVLGIEIIGGDREFVGAEPVDADDVVELGIGPVCAGDVESRGAQQKVGRIGLVELMTRRQLPSLVPHRRAQRLDAEPSFFAELANRGGVHVFAGVNPTARCEPPLRQNAPRPVGLQQQDGSVLIEYEDAGGVSNGHGAMLPGAGRCRRDAIERRPAPIPQNGDGASGSVGVKVGIRRSGSTR